MDQTTRDEIAATKKRISRVRYGVAVIFSLALLFYVGHFTWLLGPGLSPDQGAWGQFGDFIGGLLNPIVAFFAFYWLTESVHIQKQELSEARDALKKSYQEARRARRADRFASLYDELNTSEFGEDMETVGKWLDAVARAAATSREQLSDSDIQKAYRIFLDQLPTVEGNRDNSKKEPVERARRRVKSWYIKCLLYRDADDLSKKQLLTLISRDRASLMLQVFSMTRGQAAFWKKPTGVPSSAATSDVPYFLRLQKLVTGKYGTFAAASGEALEDDSKGGS